MDMTKEYAKELFFVGILCGIFLIYVYIFGILFIGNFVQLLSRGKVG